MEQYYHQYIGQTHENQYIVGIQKRELLVLSPRKPTLRSRSLLYLSDLLLILGQRVRPIEFRVAVHSVQVHEGALEIEPKGC